MPLATTEEMLKRAQKGGYAVGAFNVENMEMAQAVIQAAVEMGAPVMVQTTPSTVKYAGLHLYYANVAALGEMWQGGGMGCRDMVMVTLGTGVGGGVIIDEKIIAGRHGLAGEIGHIHVRDEETEYCNCGGRGCLEQVASATGIAREARRVLAADETPSAMRRFEDHISAKNVLDCAKSGDALALQVTETVGRYLGLACAQIALTVDPEAFVIGGGVSRAGQFLIDFLQGGNVFF